MGNQLTESQGCLHQFLSDKYLDQFLLKDVFLVCMSDDHKHTSHCRVKGKFKSIQVDVDLMLVNKISTFLLPLLDQQDEAIFSIMFLP